MNARTTSWIARTLWVLTVALAVSGVVLAYLNRSLLKGDTRDVLLIAALLSLVYATVGALIASRRRNSIGWIFCTMALGLALASFSSNYVFYGNVTSPASLPGTSFFVWMGNWALVPSTFPVGLALLLFPDGRTPTARWKPVAWASAAVTALTTVGLMVKPGRALAADQTKIADLTNPLGISWLRGPVNVVSGWGTTLAFLIALASMVALVLRFRRARGEERQQIRWMAYVAATCVVAVAALFMVATLFKGSAAENAAAGIFFGVIPLFLFLGVPIAAAIAILRYRLYDLDLVVKKTVVFGSVAGFVTLVYLAIVVAVPTLLFGAGSGGGGFSALYLVPSLIVAMAFNPIRNRARRFADRVVYGKRATPYEVLSDFAERAAGTYSTEDVLPRMVQILSAGTGATEARVWLRVGPELRLAASWPTNGAPAATLPLHGEGLPAFDERTHAFPVRHQGELLGAITVVVPPSDPLTPDQERLLTDLAAQTGLVLRNVRLIEELRASRRRIVAAQDERAKKLERNLHDGAQQQLVALSVKLGLLEQLANRDPERAGAVAAELKAEAGDALENLRDLARGIYPPLLADKGLAAALETQARKSTVRVSVEANGVGRHPQDVEAAVYFCALEALQNVAKYANANTATVRLATSEGHLTFKVTDDGVGFDPTSRGYGTGLQGMADRVEAIGGTIEIRSSPGGGTTISGRVPVPRSAASS